MTVKDLEDISLRVKSLALEVGEWMRTERKNFNPERIEKKGLNDLVSYVDKQSEQKIVAFLAELLPESGFIVEENTRSEKKENNWIVDPLDGTTNFIHGIPCYAISIALERNGEILFGLVYEVTRDELFHAIKDQGAYLNDKRVHVSGSTSLQDALIATGFPIYNFKRQEEYLNMLRDLMHKTHGIRRIGAAAADLCYLACGRVDAFFEYNLSPWDVAAGALIAREAGALISDFSDEDNWLFGKEIIAVNPALKNEFIALIQKHFLLNAARK